LNERSVKYVEFCLKLIQDAADTIAPSDSFPVYPEEAFADEREIEQMAAKKKEE
jgi:hypothetical protein